MHSPRTLNVSLHYLVKKKQVAAERLLLTQMTFSQSVMVSVGVSKLGITDLIFIDPGAKVNGAYYCEFQQDSAPAHRARDTVRLLELAIPAFIPPDRWPPNSHDLNPVYQSWVYNVDEL